MLSFVPSTRWAVNSFIPRNYKADALTLLYYGKLLKLFIVFTCMGVLPARLSLYHLCAWCPWKPVEGVKCPGTGVKGVGVEESNPGPWEEQLVILTTEPPLCPDIFQVHTEKFQFIR